ncbi:phage tail protein [Paragemmobacter straminiformis]|uniref:Tip attachment protein J domain-containing protein n=1 Tax=Paragemmobacter straminiformis TaxID=2045119 RepID=A0A842I361_9RHOB|nr:phage tail protein [Gemmobacter straminiformis]MBC2834051.1 hypothetical protein [Gemmobacter straminiformis]
MTVTTRVSRSEQFNAVRGTFISPANDWQPDDFPAIQSGVYLAEDKGDLKFLDVELPMTTSATMAQRLAKILLESARRQITVNLPGKLSAWRVGAGEVVPVTMARRGWTEKPFEVRSIGTQIEDADGVPVLVPDLLLRETSPLIWDWSATEEQIYAAAPRTALPSAFDIAAPGMPEVSESLYVTRDGTGVKAAVRLEWVASASPYVAQYVIEAREAGGVWREIGRTANTSLEAQDWTPGLWEFRVAALSTLGVASDWAVRAQEVFGVSAPPSALSDVTLQTAGGLAILKWARSTDADVRIGGNIVIRHSTDPAPTWQSSYSMDRVAGDQSLAVIPLKPGSYLLRAEDSSGQVGPVSVVATGGAQAVAFASVTVAQADPAFAGTFAGAAVIDGYLTLPGGTMWDDLGLVDSIANIDYAGGVVPSGMFTFGSGFDLGAVRNVRLRSDIGMAAFQAFAMWDDRVGEIDGWGDIDGVDGAEVDVVMEYRETDDDPAAALVWTEWSRVDSSEIRARAVQARAILSTNDAAFTVRVDRLRLYADEVI